MLYVLGQFVIYHDYNFWHEGQSTKIVWKIYVVISANLVEETPISFCRLIYFKTQNYSFIQNGWIILMNLKIYSNISYVISPVDVIFVKGIHILNIFTPVSIDSQCLERKIKNSIIVLFRKNLLLF